MGMLYATDRNGTEHQVKAKAGLTLMELLRDAGLPIEAICGGQCICSTCHIYVDDEWVARLEPRADAEQIMVEDTGHYTENSRLACQVDFEESLDGIRVALAPEY